MTDAAKVEIRQCIAHYEARGRDWVPAVTFIGIKHLFGGWTELVRGLRPTPRVYPRGPRKPKL